MDPSYDESEDQEVEIDEEDFTMDEQMQAARHDGEVEEVEEDAEELMDIFEEMKGEEG